MRTNANHIVTSLMVIIAVTITSCSEHADVNFVDRMSERLDSVNDNSRSETANTGGIRFDLSDTIMDEETETIVFNSQDWDEVDRDVDL